MKNCNANKNDGVEPEEGKGDSSDEDDKQTNNNEKPLEPRKDYIHVRARRGQATDSHSLAERVRNTKLAQSTLAYLTFYHYAKSCELIYVI